MARERRESKMEFVVSWSGSCLVESETEEQAKQDYILRKLLRLSHKNKIEIDHKFYEDEVLRQEKLLIKWEKLKDKHKDKPKEWWFDTHGIDLDLI